MYRKGGRKARREGKGIGVGKWVDKGKGTSQGKKRWGWNGKEKWWKWEENWEEAKKVKEESERRKVLILPLSWKGGKEGFRKRVKEGGWKEKDQAIGL